MIVYVSRTMLQLIESDEIDNDFETAQRMKNPRKYFRVMMNIKRKIGGGRFHFFGSRVMGVGTHDSDLDIFVGFRKFS